jgi:hypothetical protein
MGSAFKPSDTNESRKRPNLTNAQIDYALDERMVLGPRGDLEDPNWIDVELPSSDIVDGVHRFASERFQVKADAEDSTIGFYSYKSDALLALSEMLLDTLERNFRSCIKEKKEIKRPKLKQSE